MGPEEHKRPGEGTLVPKGIGQCRPKDKIRNHLLEVRDDNNRKYSEESGCA